MYRHDNAMFVLLSMHCHVGINSVGGSVEGISLTKANGIMESSQPTHIGHSVEPLHPGLVYVN